MLQQTLSGFLSLGLLTAVLCCAVGGAGSARADETTVRPPEQGERIVFLGDSITEAGNQPGGYVSLVRDELAGRFPTLGIEVIGAGISGNKVPDLEARLDRDVLARKPTTVVIYIGINDVWHSMQGSGTPKETFEKGLRSIVERIRASGARTILCTPTVIGERALGSNPLDAMLESYSDITRKVAADMKTGLLDLRKACGQHLAAFYGDVKGTFTDDKGVLTSDSVHLNAAGNRFVADRMLEALGAKAPAADAKVLRHVVLIKFKDSSSPADIDKVVTAFAALPGKISEIKAFEWGTDVSPEGKSQGLTHCFLLTFASAADRDAYLPHPAHREFGGVVGPHIDKLCVVDYWTTTP